MKEIIKHKFPYLLFFLLLVSCFASAYGQERTITLNLSKVPLNTALKEIEKQTSMSVVYNTNDVDINRVISIKVTKESLNNVMNQLFRGVNVSFSIVDNHIVLSAKSNKEEQQKKTPITASGTVTDSKGEPLIGVSILVKGTSNGTITDMDGNFKIQAAKGDVLEVSYIGYASQAITLTNAQPLKVTLGEDTQVLDEVVVTALGIKRSEKALTYNVQQVKGDELTTVKSTNFMGALAGKAAGVQINSSASGPGGGVKVVMRGAKSITQNNNALYVIDGIPMYNRASSGGDGAMATQPSSESIADINPDDIESMSLLTGPSAAALYGYEGANGVVLITTKKGRADKTTVTYSNNTTFSDPMMMPKFQNTYGNMTGEMMSWGLETDKRYDPANFFNTGSNVSNALSLSTGNDKSQSYISVATTNATGIMPNNDYDRYNFSFRNTTNFLNNKFILDTSANYIIQNDKNMVSQGQYFNPLTSLYLFPRGEDFSDVAVYERYDDLSGVNTQYWPYGDLGGVSSQNPYWIMNRMNRENDRRRYKLAASLQYNIIEGLNVQGRVSIDNTESKYTEKFHAGTVGNFAGPKGRYKEENRLDRQVYADVLVNFNKTFNEFNVTANLGASIKDLRMELTSLHGDLNNVTNHFTIENLTRSGYYKVNADGLKRQTQSVFANAEIGWRSFLYLSLTGRADWDSSLALSERGNKPFFYPSIGLSSILSEVIDLPEWFSFLKARFSFTSVGNAYDPYLTKVRYVYDDQLDQYKAESLYPNSDLKPEITKSYEAGLNMRFFKNTLNFDITYYNSDTRNQTFAAPLPASSGYTAVNIQAGSVQNQGIEMALGYKNEWRDFGWSSNFTFTYNKNKIKRLADGVTNRITGEPIEMPYVDKARLGGSTSPVVRLTEGGSMGDLYINRDFKRDNNGYIYLDAKTGLPSMVETEYKKIGSLLPKVNLGWRNSFTYKGLRLNILLSGRFGGLVVSNTQAFLDRCGVSEYSAQLRQAGGVTINNRNVSAKDYLGIVAAGTGEGDHYVYEATNIRLQEVSLEYTLPKKWLYNIADVTLGLIGNNLGMIYCKAPFDPELVASSTSTFYTGVDYFMQPSLRNMGFSIKVQF